MKRILALALVFGAGALGLTACDGSPPAVSVNGRVITVSAFDHQLAQLGTDKTFVEFYDASAAQSASQSGGNAVTLEGAGGPGTYDQHFVGDVLNLDIDSLAAQGYLSSKHVAPTPVQLVTARAIEETDPNQNPYFQSLPASLRDFFSLYTAEQALLTPLPSDPTTLQQPYQPLTQSNWLFSSVCVIESVTPNVDSANALVAAGQAPGAPQLTGARICFDQSQLEAQPKAFQTAILGLNTVGQIAAPVQTPYGFQVLQLAGRVVPQLTDPAVAQIVALDTATSNPLTPILTTAKISVNAAYGSWQGCLVAPGGNAQETCSRGQ